MKWVWVDREATLEDVQACVGKGWGSLVKRLVTDLTALGWNGDIAQVKEKFGGLRFYIGTGSEAIFERIHEAEEQSYSICEVCGQPGKLRDNGWWRTLCEEHVQ